MAANASTPSSSSSSSSLMSFDVDEDMYRHSLWLLQFDEY